MPMKAILENFLRLRPHNGYVQWESVINVSFLDYSTYTFNTLVHCISQSEKPEAVPNVLEWCKKEFGEHVFKPQLIALDGDCGTFDNIHSQFSKNVNLYVPFYGFINYVWRQFKLRSLSISRENLPILRVLLYFLKLLAFLNTDIVRNRYQDIKRVFQTDIGSDFWFDFENNYLKDDTNILKWSVINNCEDKKLILAINKHQEKSMILIDEMVKPTVKDLDNMGNLIEGIQKIERDQKEEFDQGRETNERDYYQLRLLQACLQDEDVYKSAFSILVNQCNQLKYGGDDFLGSENFVKYFFENYEYKQYVDTDESILKLSFQCEGSKEDVMAM